ncbi:MAG: sigma-54-dependent Fis family transcriptional regulator [Candidatus Schekmanbacteria bacterium]|nr:sigma-54-dependent Fis family transcriptional regulator [Candidatus Schekmanbacteria bacterium]
MRQKILVVDDERIICQHLKRVLEKEGYEVEIAFNGKEALKVLEAKQFSVAVVDIRMPEMDGLELLDIIKNKYPETAVIIMTAHGSIETAVSSMKRGAVDYLAKPFESEEILLVIERVLERLKLLEENIYLKSQVEEKNRFGNIISQNHKIKSIFDLITTVAPTDSTVMITGETGTGKELVARAVHFNSYRKSKRFVTINCGALPETLLESELFGHEKGSFTGAVRQKLGKFEFADGGTVFLDEIGDITQTMQVKLLRFVQEMEFERVGGNSTIKVNVRIICATNKNLVEEVKKGNFREDLFYRINVVPIHIPPLRERMEDVPILALHFLRKNAEKMGKDISAISQDVLDKMMRYRWPGNVRELENIIERGVILEHGNTISKLDLPDDSRENVKKTVDITGYSLPQWLDIYESNYLREIMAKYRGNVASAIRQAGVGTKTFYRKIKKYNIKRSDFEEGQ